MPIATHLTELLGATHPIMLAPMDIVADGRLAATVSRAAGFGIIGAGYGDEAWLVREMNAAGDARWCRSWQSQACNSNPEYLLRLVGPTGGLVQSGSINHDKYGCPVAHIARLVPDLVCASQVGLRRCHDSAATTRSPSPNAAQRWKRAACAAYADYCGTDKNGSSGDRSCGRKSAFSSASSSVSLLGA
jgi:hypothetical protein